MPLSEWIMCGTYIQWNTTQKLKKKNELLTHSTKW